MSDSNFNLCLVSCCICCNITNAIFLYMACYVFLYIIQTLHTERHGHYFLCDVIHELNLSVIKHANGVRDWVSKYIPLFRVDMITHTGRWGYSHIFLLKETHLYALFVLRWAIFEWFSAWFHLQRSKIIDDDLHLSKWQKFVVFFVHALTVITYPCGWLLGGDVHSTRYVWQLTLLILIWAILISKLRFIGIADSGGQNASVWFHPQRLKIIDDDLHLLSLS